MSTIVQTGFKRPQAVISNGATTGNQWRDPNNLLQVDNEVAASDSTPSAASDVVVGNFNFNIPQNAVITGIEFMIRGYRGSQTIPPITLSPYALDNTSGVDLFYPYSPAFTGLTTTMADYTLGTSTYLFATSWTVDQINNFKLQLVANGEMYIDAALVNVYYYEVEEVTPPAPIGDNCENCNSQVQAQAFELALPMNAQDTGCYVKSFNYPDGTPIQITDVGDCGGYIDITIDQSKPKGNGQNFEENARIVDIIPQSNGTTYLDFGTIQNRALMFREPYAHDATLLSPHDANAELIITNNAPFYDRFLKKCHIDVLVSVPIEILDEGASVTEHVHSIDFQGAGVTVQVPNPSNPDDIRVVIPGNSTTPPSLDDTSSTTSGDDAVTSLTWEHTTSGVDRGMLVQISTKQSTTISGVTYNGVPLTQEVTATDATGNIRSEIWSLVAPPVGTYDIVVTLSVAAEICAGAETFVGVDQAGFVGATQNATGNNNNPTLVLATTRDYSLVVDGLSTGLTPILYTPGAGQTENWHHTANTDTRQGGSSLEPAGTSPDNVTMDYSITQSTRWALTAVEVLGVPVAFSPIETYDEGILVDSNTVKFNFTGAGVDAIQTAPGEVEIQIPGGAGQAPIQFEDEGVNLGTAGTVDELDFVGAGVTATRVGDKVTVTIPGGVSGGSQFQQQFGLSSWNTTTFNTDIQGVSSSEDGSVFYAVYTTNGNNLRRLSAWQIDSVTGMYKGISTAPSIDQRVSSFCGITEIGAYVYVTYKINTNNVYTYRYDAVTLANPQLMTYSGGAPDNTVANKVSWTDGTDLFIHSTGTTYIQYTISGTTLTNAGTITSTNNLESATWDGTDVIASTSSLLLNINATTGATNTSVSAPGANPWFGGANMQHGVIIGAAGTIYQFTGTAMTGDGATVWLMFVISPYTRP